MHDADGPQRRKDRDAWGRPKAGLAGLVDFFRTGKPPYPVERTLLTSGVLDAALISPEALADIAAGLWRDSATV